jgi:hypothetical protein
MASNLAVRLFWMWRKSMSISCGKLGGMIREAITSDVHAFEP